MRIRIIHCDMNITVNLGDCDTRAYAVLPGHRFKRYIAELLYMNREIPNGPFDRQFTPVLR